MQYLSYRVMAVVVFSSSVEELDGFFLISSFHSIAMVTHVLLLIVFPLCVLSNGEQNFFESSIRLIPFGSKFQPRNLNELLNTFSSTRSWLQCAIMCNRNRQCRTFDYDQPSLICRLFEGEFSTGTVLEDSALLTSRIGAIIYDISVAPQLYSSYDQTCDHCSIGRNRYLQCIDNTCQCPIHTFWNGQLCLNQLYNGSNCSSSASSCRQDLNLTCSKSTKSCIDSETVSGVLRSFGKR